MVIRSLLPIRSPHSLSLLSSVGLPFLFSSSSRGHFTRNFPFHSTFPYRMSLSLPSKSSSPSSSSLSPSPFHPSSSSLPGPLSSPPMWSLPPSSPLPPSHPSIQILLSNPSAVIAFPTETVYGLGGSALSDLSISNIYHYKGRPSDNPLIVHIHHVDQLSKQLGVHHISPTQQLLIQKFWPGPLTILFPYDSNTTLLSAKVTAGLPTVAVRYPNHPIAHSLLKHTNIPLAAPSANKSGRPSPTTAAHVWEDFEGSGVNGIIDGGGVGDVEGGVGLESTVVICMDMDKDIDGKDNNISNPNDKFKVKILRPGGVTLDMIEEVTGKGTVMQHSNQFHNKENNNNNNINNEKDKDTKENHNNNTKNTGHDDNSSSSAPLAPGMKYTHYAPKSPLFILKSKQVIDTQFIITNIEKEYQKHKSTTESSSSSSPFVISVICFDENLSELTALSSSPSLPYKFHLLSYGPSTSLSKISLNLYAKLRECDHINPPCSVIFSVDCSGCGNGEKGEVYMSGAIMNRLEKAAGHKFIVKEMEK